MTGRDFLCQPHAARRAAPRCPAVAYATERGADGHTPEIRGVAHRTLACGTLVHIASPTGRTVLVPVIDRGPYVAGRSLDLSSATRAELGCSDLCRVRLLVIR